MNFKVKLNKTYIFIFIVILAGWLRFYKLSSFPPSLYWEEVALGYDAYSLLKTGKDHRGNSWPTVFIESYKDYKPPLYVYLTIPSVYVFGLSDFAVRFPSAFLGTLTVVVLYFLVKKLLIYTNFSKFTIEYLPLAAAFLLAISPWHLQFSRPAFEVNTALFLISTGILFFFLGLQKPLHFLVSSILLALSLYAYHGARVFAPLLIIVLFFSFIKKIWKNKRWLFLFLAVLLIFSLPILNIIKSKEISQRFQETSAFATLDPIIESNMKIDQDGGGRIARLLHHRYFEYLRIFVKNYFTHFNGSYLFLYGDTNLRHTTYEFGIFYHWEMLSLIIGLVVLLKKKSKITLFILLWLLASIVPAALTKAVPHALRSLFGLPAFIFISSLGLLSFVETIRACSSHKVHQNYRFFLAIIALVVVVEFGLYWHFYTAHYPKLYSQWWQYGYKQAVQFINDNNKDYDAVYLTNFYGRAYMYYLFYTKFDPSLAQKLLSQYKDMPDVPRLENVYFNSPPMYEQKKLYVIQPGFIKDGKLLKTINFLDVSPAFEIWETD